MRVAVLIGLSAGMGVCAARADTITAVSSAAMLGANDQVSWSQFNGSNIGGYFTAFSDNGYQVDGAFANAESSDQKFAALGSSNSTALTTYSPGYYGGAVTFTIGGASAVGATIGNPTANGLGMQFNATLTLYNGATTIGTVSGSSDYSGDPFFLGAVDTSGQNITGFTYDVTSIERPSQLGPITGYIFYYDRYAGFQDPASCASLGRSDFGITRGGNFIQLLDNAVKCPQTAAQYYPALNNGFYVTPSEYAAIKSDINPNISTPAVQATLAGAKDSDPRDIHSFSLSALQLGISGSTKWRGTPRPQACVVTKPASFANSAP